MECSAEVELHLALEPCGQQAPELIVPCHWLAARVPMAVNSRL